MKVSKSNNISYQIILFYFLTVNLFQIIISNLSNFQFQVRFDHLSRHSRRRREKCRRWWRHNRLFQRHFVWTLTRQKFVSIFDRICLEIVLMFWPTNLCFFAASSGLWSSLLNPILFLQFDLSLRRRSCRRYCHQSCRRLRRCQTCCHSKYLIQLSVKKTLKITEIKIRTC
jgi:hypothetical protein